MYISGKYEVVTPLMLGGANHAPEFRLASYAHMLRWWWRFLALGRFQSADRASYWEAVLFGWHAKPFGRKRVSFRLLCLDEDGFPAPWNDNLELNKWSGISYLTAQGFSERAPAKVKSFKVEARIRTFEPDIFAGLIKKTLHPTKQEWPLSQLGSEETDWQTGKESWSLAQKTLVDAMALIGLLGGLGARSRRGFGSLAVLRLEVDDVAAIDGLPADIKAYQEMIQTHLGSEKHTDLPPYSALSDQFTFDICTSGGDVRELMNDIGWAFQIYRSWGQKKPRLDDIPNDVKYFHGRDIKKVDGKPKGKWIPAGFDKAKKEQDGNSKAGWYEDKFADDHDKFYTNPLTNNSFDNRAVFGLPHDYGTKIKVGWDLPGENKYGRRASPLLFHFHRLGNGKAVFVASVIESKFAPDNAQLHVKNGRNRDARKNFSTNIDFSLLRGFAAFLRNPDATGSGEGVQHITFTPEPKAIP